MSRIFAKTAKGKSEIQTRENRLSPRIRQLLICVDSKKTVADIRNMELFPEQELVDALKMLTAEGFIEVSPESEAQALLLKQQKEAQELELLAQNEQNILEEAAAQKERLKQEQEELKQEKASLKASLKAEKEEQRRKERELVSGWSNNNSNNRRF